MPQLLSIETKITDERPRCGAQAPANLARVFELVQFLGKPIHIVDHVWRRRIVYLCTARKPMRGDGEDRVGTRKRFT